MAIQSPLSKSEKIRHIKNFQVDQLIIDWQRLYGIDVSNEFGGELTIQKYFCEDSGLYFYYPETVQGSADLYNNLSLTDWYYNPDKWEYHEALKEIGQGDSVLEVGCGNGEFLALLGKNGIKGIGLEINPKVKEGVFEAGYEIRKKLLSQILPEESNSFNVVCAFQVLEHLSKPDEFLKQCIDVVKKEGLIILCTPNSDSFLKYSYNPLDLPPHHMSGWSLKSYMYLEKIYPIKLEKILYEPLAAYHVEYYLDSLKNSSGTSNAIRVLLTIPLFYKIIRVLLKKGFRKFIKGQSMMAIFKKK